MYPRVTFACPDNAAAAAAAAADASMKQYFIILFLESAVISVHAHT